MRQQIRTLMMAMAFAAVATPTVGAADEMSLGQCLDAALANSKAVKASQQEVAIRRDRRKSVRGAFLPRVNVSGNALFWNEAVAINVDLSGFASILGDFSAFLSDKAKAALAKLTGDGLPINVHQDITAGVSVVVAQPLVQLFTVHAGYKATGELATAATLDVVTTRRQLQADVVQTYIGLIVATRMQDTLNAALEQLAVIRTEVEAYLKAELVERNALLKVEVHTAEIQRSLYEAQKAAKLARALLNLYMGRPFDSPLDPVMATDDLLLPNSSASLAQYQDRAAARRPELASARHQQEAARWGARASMGKMLPEINLVFKYDYTHGLEPITPANEFFGGIVLSWNIWDWGVSYYQMNAERGVAKKTEMQIDHAEDMVRLDVENKWLELEKCGKDLAVARSEVAQAEENMRIVKLRFDQHEATTSELLEAQTMQLKAHNGLLIAEMKQKAAGFAFMLSVGSDLRKGTTTDFR